MVSLQVNLCSGSIDHLGAGLLGPSGAGLLVQVDTESGPQRYWLLLLPRQPSLCPGGSSPGDKQEVIT